MEAALQRGVLHVGLAPQVFAGRVIHGFGRGSKELGCPTANIPIGPYEQRLAELPLGVYWGLASVNSGPVLGMALNIGWSPFYGNKEKTIEIHVLAKVGCCLSLLSFSLYSLFSEKISLTTFTGSRSRAWRWAMCGPRPTSRAWTS